MRERNCSGSTKNLAEMVVGVINVVRNIRRFLLQPESHPDWSDLVQDMPEDLRTLLSAVDQAEGTRVRASERRYQAEQRLSQLSAKFKAVDSERSDSETVDRLRAAVNEARSELAGARRAFADAEHAWREAGRALSPSENFNRMAAYHQGKKKMWLTERYKEIRAQRDGLDRAISGQLHRLESLPGRLGIKHHARIRANSATLVLLRLAKVVESDLDADLLDLNLDELHEDVVHEMSVLASGHVAEEQAPTTARKPRAVDRLTAAAAALIREGIYNASQADLAKRAGCSCRELRRGPGKDVWKNYVNAGARPQEAVPPRAAPSRQQRLVSEKLRHERRSRGE